MKYSEEFKGLSDNLKKEQVSEEYKFLGSGCPNSDILIIGKEVAGKVGDEQYNREVLGNFKFWNDYVLSNSFNKKLIDGYSPLYPYKGQKLKRYKKGNCGTSPTWINYQKLINYIYDTPNNNEINFHLKSFSTEVNSTSSYKTKEADTLSIEFRKENILKSEYIKDFKVIIISGVGYFNISKECNEIEKIFEVDFINKIEVDGKSSQPFWIHWNKNRTKLLINTWQLGGAVSKNRLIEIANVIRESNLISLDFNN